MPTQAKRPKLFETDEGKLVEATLAAMQADAGFNTEDSYTPNGELYPGNVMPFIDKHKQYLMAHPAIDTTMYLANLRLKTKLRSV